MISIQHLTRRYGSVVAVDDVTTEIQRGEIVGLLGHNGAGKTTMMRVLTGYLAPSSGTAVVGGADVTKDRIGVQSQIGYLAESAPLYGEMLVQEYLLMMAALRGLSETKAQSAVGAAIHATGLSKHVVQPIQTLSKGYRQRVGLAQAILHDPDVLVLDEPTNGLDPIQIHSIRDLIKELGQKTTIILSTHILQEIEAVCDRVMVMIQGQLAADAPLTELVSDNAVHMSLSDPAHDVAERLSRISGITEIEAGNGASTEGQRWVVRAAPGTTPPVQEIIDAGREAGWTFASIAPEQRSLETVFKQLQSDHIQRLGGQA